MKFDLNLHIALFSALLGPHIEAEHCVFTHTDGQVTLVPIQCALCSVNNVRIHTPSKLTQGAYTLSLNDLL